MKTRRRNPTFPQLTGALPWAIGGLGALAVGVLLYQQRPKPAPLTPPIGVIPVPAGPPPPATLPPSGPALPPGTNVSTGQPATPATPPDMVVGSAARRAAIAKVYREVLCREPDATGMAAYDRSALSLTAISADIQQQPEGVQSAMVRRLYREFLGRDPLFTAADAPQDCAGLRYHVDIGASEHDMREAMPLWPEYVRKHPPAPAGAPAAPAAGAVTVAGIWLNQVTAPSSGQPWRVQPGQQITGAIRFHNPAAAPTLLHASIIWRNDNDGSGYQQGDLTVPAGADADWAFNLQAPGRAGRYQAFFGFYAGGVALNDPGQAEGGAWDLEVAAATAAGLAQHTLTHSPAAAGAVTYAIAQWDWLWAQIGGTSGDNRDAVWRRLGVDPQRDGALLLTEQEFYTQVLALYSRGNDVRTRISRYLHPELAPPQGPVDPHLEPSEDSQD